MGSPQKVCRSVGDANGSGRERRRAPRWATELPGQIELEGLRISLGCRVLDMSANGARVELSQISGRVRSALDLPDRIVLALPIDKVDVIGAVRWRLGKVFGIEFSSPFKPRRAPALG